jgi:dolichol-phosphate mannosyltransferase
MATLHVIVPALNEAPNIGRVVDDLKLAAEAHEDRFGVSLILVDDGSTDGTGERALEVADHLPVEVLRHPHPRGPGQAFATGFAHLSDRLEPGDYVLTLEADNTSRLEILDAMVRRSDDDYEVVFASPYMYGGGILHTDPLRIALSHVANAFVKEFLGVHGLQTVSSFYRLYRGEAILRLQRQYGAGVVERAGFECMIEMTMKMMYLGIRISEVPMVLDTSRRIGKSKMRVMRTARGYFALFSRKRRWNVRAADGLAGDLDGLTRAHAAAPDLERQQ